MRRLTMLDAMVLIAATAVALLPAGREWPLAREVFRKVNLPRLVEFGPGGDFTGRMRTGRTDSLGLAYRNAVESFSGVGPRQEWTGRLKPDGTRATYKEQMDNWSMMRTGVGGSATGYAASGEAYVLALPFMIAWTAALLFLRLRRPRPPASLLWRQPGWWASVAAAGGVALGFAEEAVIEFPCPTGVIPLCVLLAWAGLAASRKWTSEASWVDRAGRVLGAAWIAMVPLNLLGFVIPHLR